ncbi:MAG: hypothetical protein ABW252_11265 [Polyangiales bacterium]
MSFYLVRPLGAPRVPERDERSVRAASGAAAASRGNGRSIGAMPRPAAASRNATAATREDKACAEAAMSAGQTVRDAVARWSAARAYGLAAPPEVDFIDVPFEEVHEPVFVRSLARGSALHALPGGEREV